MDLLTRFLSANRLKGPDGRPLYRYQLSEDTFAQLEETLRLRVASVGRIERAAPQFVLWAAEHLRSRFAGGPLKWAFVLDPLGLPSDDQSLGRCLAKQGLQWWGREIKKSDAGLSMFLYSLLAEGGIPEALLKESKVYRNAVMGLLAEIEAEGGFAAEPWVEQMALRWRSSLPQAFQRHEFTILLAGLALSITKLRALLPNDWPEAGAEKWLNKHRPDWTSSIPLRMAPEIAESLISPALAAKRGIRPAAAGPLCGRELRLGADGSWQGYLLLHDNAWLDQRYFSGAAGLRLRLLPTGSDVTEGVAYNATPEEEGWRLRRLGKSGRTSIPLKPSVPFAFSAFADGQVKGEAVIDAGIPHPIEAPSFWRPAELSDGASAHCLTPLTGGARTRGPCLWILTPNDEEPEAGDGLTLNEVETAPGGLLWRISGRGALHVGNKRYTIVTAAEEDAWEARILAFGATLRRWRLGGNIPVYHGDIGDIELYGELKAGHFMWLSESQLRRVQGRELCSEVVEWMQGDEVLARFRFVCVPKSVNLALHEVSAGRVALSADGLPRGWRLGLEAGEIKAASDLQDSTIELTLDTPGTAPGLVRLRLSEPATGRALELQAAWPARSGMIVDPNGHRLRRHRPISDNALQGWRALTPEGRPGGLQLQLTGSRAVSLPIAGEVSIASHLPSIQAMLAQGGPDSQVNLSLVVSGMEGPRLEIRRYHDNAVVKDGILHMGLGRDVPRPPETVLAGCLNEARRALLRAVNLSDSNTVGPIETNTSVDLASHLEQSRGAWLIQSTLEGRVQRAVVWNPRSDPEFTRQERINDCARHWRTLSTVPQHSDWDRMWRLISAVGEGGDIGVIDQVQALAMVPVAAISLALRVPREELSEVLALETAAPIFWPTLKVTDFEIAVRAEHMRRQQKFAQHLDDAEAEEMADYALAQRIGDLFHLRPDLAGHLCAGLLKAGLLKRLMARPEACEHVSGLLPVSRAECLFEAAQEALKRFDRLPHGVGGLQPVERPKGLPVFNQYAQAMIDAPLVAAEMATARRSAPDIGEKLALINLRLVDPLYFDAALPAAIAHYMQNNNR